MNAINEILDEKSISIFVGAGVFGYLKFLGVKEKDADKIVKRILPSIIDAIELEKKVDKR